MEKNMSTREPATTTSIPPTIPTERYHITDKLYTSPPIITEPSKSVRSDVVVRKSTTTTDVVVVLNIDLTNKEERIRRANDLIDRSKPITVVSSGS